MKKEIYVENIGRGPLIGNMIEVIGPNKEPFSEKFVLAVGEQTKIKLAEEEKYQENIVTINIKYNDIYSKKYQEDFELETHIDDTTRIYSEKGSKRLTKDE